MTTTTTIWICRAVLALCAVSYVAHAVYYLH